MTEETAKKKDESTPKPEEKPTPKGTPPGTITGARAQAAKKGAIKRPRCTTCGLSVESEKIWVDFKCPSCGKTKIIRCERCKRLENPYTCEGCGFKGP